MTSAAPDHHPDPSAGAGADVPGPPAAPGQDDLQAQVDLLQAVIQRLGLEDAVAQIVALEDLRAEIAVHQRRLDDLMAQARRAERQLTR